MTITVRLFANFREAAEKDRMEVTGVTDVASLIEKLVELCGDKMAKELYRPKGKRVTETVHILVNDKMVDVRGGLKTPLKDGDVVAIFPPVAGGGPTRKELERYGRQIIIPDFRKTGS
jgi:MoaD family protein